MKNSEFIIIPAIDLKGGKCVRLTQGLANAEKVYSGDPLSMALEWQEKGAKWLHVVDLDGAFEGKPAHTEIIKNIVRELEIPVEVGGGLRSDSHISEILGAGAARAIIGTRACESPDELSRLVREFGDKLAVGIDARDGLTQTRGWTETTSIKAVDLAERMNTAGVATVIYTDTALDGMMKGTNVPGNAAMCKALKCNVIASGGITNAEDVKALRAINAPNLVGCIVGKALYEHNVTFEQLATAAGQP